MWGGRNWVIQAQTKRIFPKQILCLYSLAAAGADTIKNDGVYSKYLFSFARNGRYSLKVRVQRDSQTISPYPAILWSPAMYIPGYITNGKALGCQSSSRALEHLFTSMDLNRRCSQCITSSARRSPTLHKHRYGNI